MYMIGRIEVNNPIYFSVKMDIKLKPIKTKAFTVETNLVSPPAKQIPCSILCINSNGCHNIMI